MERENGPIKGLELEECKDLGGCKTVGHYKKVSNELMESWNCEQEF